MFTQSLAVLGPEMLAKHIKIDEYIKRRAAALSIDAKDLVKSQKELDAEMQQAQQQQQQMQQAEMMKAGIPNAVKAMGDNANQQTEEQLPPEEPMQ